MKTALRLFSCFQFVFRTTLGEAVSLLIYLARRCGWIQLTQAHPQETHPQEIEMTQVSDMPFRQDE
jgi:hypothetical protein